MKRNKIKNIIKNYHPSKKTLFLYFNIPLLIVLAWHVNYNDIWFLLNHGRYILNNGFPIIEPFTIHHNFSFVMQQWLSSIIFYLSYSLLGKYGLLILTLLVTAYIIFISYKLCMLLSNNRYSLSVLITTIMTSLLAYYFITSRPHIFTYAIIITEIYLLEKYIKEKDKKYLYGLPILSLLQINLHASMFFMQFAFLLPYIIDSFHYKIGPLESEGYKKKPLFITGIIMFLVGFLNPYGIDGVTYIFRSFGNSYINELVNEMAPLLVSDLVGKVCLFIIFAIICIYIFYKKSKIRPRYFYLLIGTIYLTFTAYKGLAYLLIGGILPLAYYLKNAFKKNEEQKNIRKYKYLLNSSCLVLIGLLILIGTNSLVFTYKYKEGIDYILEDNKASNITLYTGYNEGSYPEWKGIRCYIDPRAEVFLKENNEKKDIMEEYYLLQNGKLNIANFLEEYKFSHLLIPESDYLYQNMDEIDNYKIIYENTSTNEFGLDYLNKKMKYRIYQRIS